MPSKKRKVGDAGESIAKDYLQDKGYHIIERNYLKPWGEIDIVSSLKNRLIFFEVKTRNKESKQYFLPESTINRKKSTSLRKVCETYLSEKKLSYQIEWQIDLLYIALDKETGKYDISHYENVVWDQRY